MKGPLEKGKSAGRKKKQRDGKFREAEKTQDVEGTQEVPTEKIECHDHVCQGHHTREILGGSMILGMVLRDNF